MVYAGGVNRASRSWQRHVSCTLRCRTELQNPPARSTSRFRRAPKVCKRRLYLMKRNLSIALLFLAAAGFAAAQIQAPSTDVLGAHLNYGRGCAACHAPHSGAYGNGNAKTADTTSGNVALWGEDVASLYGKTITSGSTDGSTGFTEVLPTSFTAGTPDVGGLLTCLSCHDGNYAQGAMMKNQVYETLPASY